MKKIISEKNPELVTRKDNKAQWNLPNKRRLGFRNLYKINRYGIYLRSDFVLKLKNQHIYKEDQKIKILIYTF